MDQEAECSFDDSTERVEKEVPKEFMVHYAHAVTHPRTVMVHSHHTLVANWAVMSAWRFNHLTLMTIPEPYIWRRILIESGIHLSFDSVPFLVFFGEAPWVFLITLYRWHFLTVIINLRALKLKFISRIGWWLHHRCVTKVMSLRFQVFIRILFY